ncbi:adhesion G protein-coupled receptor B2 [Trichonephila clavipes]|nr:adhesion G protein-coupled receptor B2 [Trichonephila clavipes]
MALCGNGQSCRLRFRGMDYLKLKTCELWWNGPKFLMSNQYPQRQILLRYGNQGSVLRSKYDFWHRSATAGSDVVQSGRPIFEDFFQPLWPYIGNNTANVVFQTVKRLWLIRIDQ